VKIIPYLLIALAVRLASPAALGQFLPSGISTITLSMSGTSGSSAMNIAWNPNFQQYYGGMGGAPTYTGVVWNSSGTVLQLLTPVNTDIRSFYYNSNTGNIEDVTYSANNPSSSPSANYGYYSVGLNGSGLLTGVYTSKGVVLSGLPSVQTVPSYDAVRNLLYGFNNLHSVNAVSAATGLVVTTITLDLASAGTSSLMADSIGYDPVTDALIGFTTTGGNRALAFNATTGAFLASIPLTGLVSPASDYGLGFANGQLFIYDGSLNAYRGYFITSIPEPATASFLAVGLLAFAAQGWRLRRNRGNAGSTAAQGSSPRSRPVS
jgi:hypothetical protein